MKHIFPTRQVCHLWANQSQSNARNSSGSVFFEDATIFSYGRHFPIARHVTNKRGDHLVLFTTREYSVTTASHIRMTLRALPENAPIVFTGDVLATPSGRLLEEIQGQIEALRLEGTRRRTRLYGLEKQVALKANTFTRAARFIGSRRNAKVPPESWYEMLEKKRARANELDKTAMERKTLRDAKKKIRDRKDFEAWFEGGPTFPASYRRHNGSCFMRIEGDEVVTNEGAHVPLDDVRKVYPLILGFIAEGKVYTATSVKPEQVGAFTLNEIRADGTVVVGCHPFCKEEILRFGHVLYADKGV